MRPRRDVTCAGWDAEFSRTRIDASVAELAEEREAVRSRAA
ncbi:hypothetical protein [Streptomyces sp. bgisy027]